MVHLRSGERSCEEDGALPQHHRPSFSDVEVIRQFAVSKDNTRMPLNIMRRKGTKLDGNNPDPAMVTAATGSASRPLYRGAAVWLDHGGVFVIANSAAAANTARTGTAGATHPEAERLRRLYCLRGVSD